MEVNIFICSYGDEGKEVSIHIYMLTRVAEGEGGQDIYIFWCRRGGRTIYIYVYMPGGGWGRVRSIHIYVYVNRIAGGGQYIRIYSHGGRRDEEKDNRYIYDYMAGGRGAGRGEVNRYIYVYVAVGNGVRG